MGLIYHYTRFETFMSFIWPSGCIRTNFLRDMNDPRESLEWSFGSTNLPYEEIFKGNYSDKSHIACQFQFGNLIKDRYQVLCFSGAKSEGWNNEMMWAHYGGLHLGVCLEFDEEMLLGNLSAKYTDINYRVGNVDYSNQIKKPWINWQQAKSEEENMSEIPVKLVQEVALAKSFFWEREDERRLVCINSDKQFFIPIQNALKTVHFGVNFIKKYGIEMADSVFKNLEDKSKLSRLIYQRNRFERWGIRINSHGKINTCDFEDLL